jgi:Protein of unknown function (DUF5818)
MQSIKRDLTIGLSVSGLVFACALAWGSPFVATGSGAALTQEPQQTQPPQQQPQPDQAQPQPDQSQSQAESKVFVGTVVKSGQFYVLRVASGQRYKLDDPESAKPYEGKSAKVTGQLDEQAMLIHVESIQGAES